MEHSVDVDVTSVRLVVEQLVVTLVVVLQEVSVDVTSVLDVVVQVVVTLMAVLHEVVHVVVMEDAVEQVVVDDVEE